MKLQVRARHVDVTPALHELVNRRVRFTLARFEHAVREVHVTLGDSNGPRGGVDKTCQVRLGGPGVADIVVHTTALELSTAVDDALHRAAEAVTRALGRRRDVAVTA